MKFFMHTKIGLFIASLIAVFIFGATFTGCQAEPAQAKEPEVIANPTLNFPESPDLFATDCHPLLKYEISIESQARKQKCGVK